MRSGPVADVSRRWLVAGFFEDGELSAEFWCRTRADAWANADLLLGLGGCAAVTILPPDDPRSWWRKLITPRRSSSRRALEPLEE